MQPNPNQGHAPVPSVDPRLSGSRPGEAPPAPGAEPPRSSALPWIQSAHTEAACGNYLCAIRDLEEALRAVHTLNRNLGWKDSPQATAHDAAFRCTALLRLHVRELPMWKQAAALAFMGGVRSQHLRKLSLVQCGEVVGELASILAELERGS